MGYRTFSSGCMRFHSCTFQGEEKNHAIARTKTKWSWKPKAVTIIGGLAMNDKIQQGQKQDVNQQTVVNNNSVHLEAYCPHYTNEDIKRMEALVEDTDGDMFLSSDKFKDIREIKESKKVRFLQHEGRVTQVFCHLLDSSTYMCEQPNKRCHLLPPRPVLVSNVPEWSHGEYDPFKDM